MAPLPSSGPISLQMIYDEFVSKRTNGNGYELDDYRGSIYWLADYPYTQGSFSTSGNLNISEFYGKRATDPVTPGSINYDSGSGTISTPVYRQYVKIEAWGGGGGGGPAIYGWDNGRAEHPKDNGTNGGTTSISLTHIGGSTSMTSTGGVGGNFGFRRGPKNGSGGANGTGSISSAIADKTTSSGVGGGAGNAGSGNRSSGGAGGRAGSPGGAGGAAGSNSAGNGNPGGAPGGGGGGGGFSDGKKKDPSCAGGGGGGGAGYSRVTFTRSNLAPGTRINYSVGAAGVGRPGSSGTGSSGNGGTGRFKITWDQ